MSPAISPTVTATGTFRDAEVREATATQRGHDDEPASRHRGETALDGTPAPEDDHGAMPRVRSPICRGRWLLTGVVLLLLAMGSIFAARGGAQEAPRPLLLVISIDGLRPDYVTAADSYQAKIPNLRRFLKDGAFADGVEGVIPTVTYPSHTTLITGVWPAVHGILANTTFDPRRENQGGFYCAEPRTLRTLPAP